MTGVYILLGLILITSAFAAWISFSSKTDGDPRLKAELDRRMEEIGELKKAIQQMQSEKDEMSGKGKQLYDNYKNLEADLKALTKERDGLEKQLAKYEAHEEQLEQKQEDKMAKLESAEKALLDEKARIRSEDEERLEEEEAERDRMWAEHEISVVSYLTDLCKKPQYAFTSYDNTTLPEEEGFKGHFKPDFVISFLEQFVIFDAKVSKSENISKYIQDNVKLTAKKVKGKDNIYPTVFFVIPAEAMKELKQTAYYEDGFTFYAVSPESLAPILAIFKKLETYEFAQEMDPQERENIIELLAQLDFHISTRNAVDFHLMQHGLATMSKANDLDPELNKEVAIKKAKIRHLNLTGSEHKQLTDNPELVKERLLELTEPKAKLKKDELR
ncbi:MAG: hypothetical protein QF741_00515 [Candidatus Peribacteraceae bacterium]|jgi:hypothetical protein|nr:hypothetical protein [Candidatus Peribacteraceae bacterium]MDP7454221.1 hypothetical protein [Candidatus Peribacteraceae bacterium]|tara:strand:- start:213 stop:1373 length:1161 start_codon:yes stop_codon:yes gene_type:complete